MSRLIDLDNPRYRKSYKRPFGELCTRMRMLNGEKINDTLCCYGLISAKTDEYEKECQTCENLLVWR